LISAASLTSFVAAAAIPPGIYVAEQDGANGNTGSIVNVAGGGDVSNATRFATNLDAPTGMCAGPGGDLYVLDLLEQQVKIATSGGNLGNSSIFATGLAGFSMACTSTQILVAIGSGNVIDITAGGDFAAATPYASGLWAVYSIAFADNGTLWAARAQSAIPPTPIDPGKPALTEVVDITGGGDFAGATAHASFPDKSFLNSVIPMSDGSC
jgi:hypothetical protein